MVKKFDPIKLTDNFYQIGTPYFPGYLSMGEVNMLIDGGTSATAGIVASQIDALNIDPASIEYIAITHSHGDHIGALSRLKKKWPHMKTIASEGTAKMLSNPKVIEQFEGFDMAVAKNMKSGDEIEALPAPMDPGEYNFNVDIIADDSTCIDLGKGLSWRVLPTPGHAGCQVAFYEAHEGSAAIGDVIGFYNQQRKVFWPNYFESLADYVGSIKKVASLEPVRVGLGHNGAVTDDIPGFLASALEFTKNYHEEMVKRAGNGEEIKDIADDKANQMKAYSGHMVFVVPMMCQVLIKQSLKAVRDEAVPDFKL